MQFTVGLFTIFASAMAQARFYPYVTQVQNVLALGADTVLFFMRAHKCARVH